MKKTVVFILAVVLVVAAFDIYLIANGQESISNLIYKTSKEWAILPLLIGILLGHLFWPNRPKCTTCGGETK